MVCRWLVAGSLDEAGKVLVDFAVWMLGLIIWICKLALVLYCRCVGDWLFVCVC